MRQDVSWLQSALDPAGPAAGRIATAWWIMLVLGTIVFVTVLVLFLLALHHAHAHRRPHAPELGETPRSGGTPEARDEDEPGQHIGDHEAGIGPGERRATTLVAAGAFATLLILVATLGVTMWAQIGSTARDPGDALTIEVTGRQWWWDVVYPDPSSGGVRTANVVHVPVGVPVRLKLISHDVIHSFWVPNLQGKMDLIPGKENDLWLQADRPGSWRGQCAEFCGLQHANMAFTLVAQPRREFERWLAHQRQAAAPPTDSLAARGQDVFLENGCSLCHTIRGTTALASVAPDLTHLASRPMLAAGMIPNTRGHLAGWIADPQSLKPGSHMPSVPLDGASFHALLHYLSTLR